MSTFTRKKPMQLYQRSSILVAADLHRGQFDRVEIEMRVTLPSNYVPSVDFLAVQLEIERTYRKLLDQIKEKAV